MTGVDAPTIFAEYLFSCSLAAFLTIVCLRTYRNFFVGTQQMDLRFRFFEIRDNLATLAVRGSISESAPEYVHLRNILNAYIRALEEVGFVPYVYAVIRTADDTKKAELIASIKRNSELAELYSKAYELSIETLYKNSLIVKGVVWCITYFKAVSTIVRVLGEVTAIGALFTTALSLAGSIRRIEEVSKDLRVGTSTSLA